MWNPENCCDIDPIRTIVSRYTCGFKKVKAATTDIVGKRLFKVDASILIVLLDLSKDFNRNNPYPASQIADRPKRVFKCWLIKLYKSSYFLLIDL